MDRIYFIVNPIAGGGKAKELVSEINKLMQQTGIDYDLSITGKPREAIILSKEALGKGYNKIVAVGGDGTVNEVAMGIMEFGGGILGVIPCGTGNDLVRTLTIPMDLKQALETILNGTEKEIDIGLANGELFLNIASIGFDSEVVKNTERIKKRIKSSFAYVLGVLVTLIGIKEMQVNLRIDDISLGKNIFLMAVGNGKFYGGGLKILPMAIIDDGYFHICIVNKLPRLKLLFLLPTLIKGTHIKYKEYVEIYRGKEIEIIAKAETYLNLDGEVQGIEEKTVFAVGKKKLLVLLP